MPRASSGTISRSLRDPRLRLVPGVGTDAATMWPEDFAGLRRPSDFVGVDARRRNPLAYQQREDGSYGWQSAQAGLQPGWATRGGLAGNEEESRKREREHVAELERIQTALEGQIRREIQKDELLSRAYEAAKDRRFSTAERKDTQRFQREQTQSGYEHDIDRAELLHEQYRERDEQQFEMDKQRGLFDFQLEAIKGAEGKISELRGTLAQQEMTPEGRKIWAKLNTELTGIQKMKQFALSRNPGEYERMLGDWMTKVEDSGLQHHVKPKPTVEEALKGRFKMMENGWGVWLQPDGKFEMRDLNREPQLGGAGGGTAAAKPVDRNAQWKEAVKSVQAYKASQGLGDAYTTEEVYEEMARMDERDAAYSEFLKRRSDPVQRASMDANKTIEAFGANVLAEFPSILDSMNEGSDRVVTTAQNLSPKEAAMWAMYYARHLVPQEVLDAFETLRAAKEQPAQQQGMPGAQPGMPATQPGPQPGMPAGPQGPQVMPGVMMQPPLRQGQMPGPQPQPTPVQRGPMPGGPMPGGQAPSPAVPGQAPQQQLQRMAGQQVPAIPPQGPQGPVQRPHPAMSPAMGGQVQQPERPPITLENLQRASIAANGQPPGVTPPARPPQDSAESQAIRPTGIGTTAERRKLLEDRARELQKLAKANGGTIPASKAIVAEFLRAAFEQLERDEAKERQQQHAPRLPAESTPGPFWR